MADSIGGFLTNGLPTLPQVGSAARLPVDTEFGRGLAPQSVSASAFQISSALGDCLLNMVADMGGQAWCNTLGGIITTCPLGTPPGHPVHMILNNCLIDHEYISGGRAPEVGIYSGSNTGGRPKGSGIVAAPLVQALLSPGRAWWTWVNRGDSPLNGTMAILWHL